MKVVLLDNIRGIGQVGDIKEVSDGYARNFLLARGKAKPATQGIVKDVASLKAKKLQALALARDESQALAAKLAGTRVELAGRASEKGTLFAGVEAKHIARALSAAAGIQIPSEAIHLPEHLKTIGEHPVTVALADGVTTQVVVSITEEK